MNMDYEYGYMVKYDYVQNIERTSWLNHLMEELMHS